MICRATVVHLLLLFMWVICASTWTIYIFLSESYINTLLFKYSSSELLFMGSSNGYVIPSPGHNRKNEGTFSEVFSSYLLKHFLYAFGLMPFSFTNFLIVAIRAGLVPEAMGTIFMAEQSFCNFFLSHVTQWLQSLSHFHWMHRNIRGLGINVECIVLIISQRDNDLLH